MVTEHSVQHLTFLAPQLYHLLRRQNTTWLIAMLPDHVTAYNHGGRLRSEPTCLCERRLLLLLDGLSVLLSMSSAPAIVPMVPEAPRAQQFLCCFPSLLTQLQENIGQRPSGPSVA